MSNPFKKSSSLPYQIRVLIGCAVVLGALIIFLVKDNEQEPGYFQIITIRNGKDTTVIDVTGWDSIRLDSLARSTFKQPTIDDSIYSNYYEFYPLDSFRASPLIDSILNGMK